MTTHRIRITWTREMEIDVKRNTTHNDVQRLTGIDELPAVVDPEHGLIAIVMPLWAFAQGCVRVTP